MQEFSLNIETPINGIYLNSETIELLSIIQCRNIEELKDFAINCSQLNISEEDLTSWNDKDIEQIKRNLVEQYKNTLVSMEQSIKNRRRVLELALKHSGITADEVDLYISVFQKEGYEGIKKKLKAEHHESYAIFTEKAHRFIGTERDQMTSITYEELSALNDILSNHNTILIGAGRYYDVTKKMYDEHITNMEKYDFYYAQRGLDFGYKNGMNVRYHTLLDKQTMEEHLIGKPKDDVLRELQEYVKQSIDFISRYNEEHKINGRGVICSVDLFNEIVSFDAPYRNMWQELYGISNEELVSIFQYALENKPDGVTYVYNEPFLENPERRKVVIEQLSRINELAPGLIDTIGTQMHIEMTQDIEDIRQCFNDLKKLKELGIGTQITEFDMCLPERFMFDENGKVRSEQELVELINSKISKSGITIRSIAEFKSMIMNKISRTIEETGIQLDGITYWSISDTLDHNLERINRKTYEQGLRRDIAQTRYAGLYSGLERSKTISTQRLYQEINIEDMTELGRGACSIVYKYDDSTVVKLFKESGKKMFTLETFSQLAGISNFTCVFPKQAISIDGQFAGYSMEYVKGQKLYEVIDTLDIQKLIDSIKKVEIDLQALSKEKILFQDVNQGNIMWDEQNGCIKVIDTDFFEKSENATEQQCYSNNISSFNNILEMELGMLNAQGSKLAQFLHNNPEFNKSYRKYIMCSFNGKNMSVTELIQKAVEIIENEFGTKVTTFAEINQILQEQSIDLEQRVADVPIFEIPNGEQKDVKIQKVGFKQKIANMLSKNTLLRKIPFIDVFVKEQESLLLLATPETPIISESKNEHQKFVNRLAKNGEYGNLPVGQKIKNVMRDAIEAAKEDYKEEQAKFKDLEPHSMSDSQKVEQMRRKMDGQSLDDDL